VARNMPQKDSLYAEVWMPLPFVTFYHCSCGTEYRALQNDWVRAKVWIHECECGKPLILYGGILAVSVAINRDGRPRQVADWIPIPTHEIRDWT
jgi:hypothetical protein